MTQENNPQDSPEPKVRIKIRMVESKPRDISPEAVVERLLKRPTTIHLFTDFPDPVFDIKEYAQYLYQTFGRNFTVIYEGEISDLIKSQEKELQTKSFEALAKANLARVGQYDPVLLDKKIEMEKEALNLEPSKLFSKFADEYSFNNRTLGAHGRIYGNDYYDTSELGQAFSEIIPLDLRKSDQNSAQTVLVITGRGVGNKEMAGVHMRAGFSYGGISVVSTTGLVEAPGKPREAMRALQTQGMGFEDPEKMRQFYNLIRTKYNNTVSGEIMEKIIEDIFHDQMLHKKDPRINEAVKGLSLSMTLFSLGEYGSIAQCSTTNLQAQAPDLTKTCRLHDAHWQEELIKTQVKDPNDPEFCNYHQQIFDKLKK